MEPLTVPSGHPLPKGEGQINPFSPWEKVLEERMRRLDLSVSYPINPHPKKSKKLNPHELGRPYIQIVETRDMRPVIG